MKSITYDKCIIKVAAYLKSDENKVLFVQDESHTEVQSTTRHEAAILLAVIFNKDVDIIENDICNVTVNSQPS